MNVFLQVDMAAAIGQDSGVVAVPDGCPSFGI